MRVCVVRAPKLVLWLLMKGSRLECLYALGIFPGSQTGSCRHGLLGTFAHCTFFANDPSVRSYLPVRSTCRTNSR
jgi:hypothetical protein